MTPKDSSIKTGCPQLLTSDCIKWVGPNIKALGIETNDNITKVEYSIASKLCSLMNKIDLSELDLTCLEANIPSGNYSVKQVLQYLLDNQCTLKALIEAGNGSTDTGTVDITSVNLKCLKKYDSFNNEIHQTVQQAIQSIVNEVCDHKTAITGLKSQVDSLQETVDNLDLTPEVQIPNVNTCISTAKPVTRALIETTAVLCEVKEIVGETLDIQDAMSKQCTGLKTKIGSPDGFKDTAVTLADSLNNIWLTLCNVLARVDYIEKTCCAPSCDNLEVGFLVEFIDQTAKISFTTGAGTKIPQGFVDCGSTLTITNQDGIKFSPSEFTVSQGGIIEGIDVSMFSLGDTLTFGAMAKMCNDSLHCEKCISKEVKYVSDGCCVITNKGLAEITLVYEALVPTSSQV